MAKQESFVDELMDFNPQDLAVFNEQPKQSFSDPDLYKTNPLSVTKETSPDGHYHSKIRILYNPFKKEQSVVKSAKYAMFDADGFFMVDSKLANNDRNCPVFKAWKALHFSNDETKYEIGGQTYTKKEWGDKMYEKNEAQYVLVQVMEDNNQPDLVGRFMGMKLPKAIFDVMQAKMHPTDSSKAPQDLMNYLFGPILEMDVTPGPEDPEHPERKQREIKYTLCAFEADPTPIMAVDGTPLFNDDEMEAILDYAEGKKVIMNPKSTTKKKEEATKRCKELVDVLKGLMQRAVDYVKENAFDLQDKYGYHEPTAEEWTRVQNWIDTVAALKDPADVASASTTTITEEPDVAEEASEESDADLPF